MMVTMQVLSCRSCYPLNCLQTKCMKPKEMFITGIRTTYLYIRAPVYI